jgi:glucose-1-phosphate cytidylyltransferase
MVEVGGKPILWHIMKIYSAFGINDFVVCLGYKGYMIKEYFANYALHSADVTFDLGQRSIEYHNNGSEDWRVTLVDTGDQTMTGGRLKRIARFLNDGTFCMTYGDGVSDVNVGKLLEFHKRNNVLATVSAVQPPGRFGSLSINSEKVDAFVEKPLGDGGWINAGFFVLEPKVLDYIAGDAISWENEPLERLAHDGQLAAYKHRGFWQAMDTLRDCKQLNTMWDSGKAPWMVWDKQEATVTDAEEDFTPSPNIRRATIV